jgi:hypothetical protein
MSTDSTSTVKTRLLNRIGKLYIRYLQLDYGMRHWGTTEQDYELSFPCDRYVREPHGNSYRAVDIQAPAEIVYPWLCQLRLAPYSYDWVDNYCRRSPKELIPGAERVSVGQRWFIKIFEIAEFETGRHLTLYIGRARWFWGPDVAATYLLVPHDSYGCRLVVNVAAYDSGGIAGFIRKKTFPAGELVMMRRQLLNIKLLAEAQAREGEGSAPAMVEGEASAPAMVEGEAPAPATVDGEASTPAMVDGEASAPATV